MSLAGDLLDQAVQLASLEQRRPKQASLRRAISTAYYSLFHLIVDEAVGFLIATASLRAGVARSFEHKDLRSAAKAIGDLARGGHNWIEPHIRNPISKRLADVCDTLVDLQDQRHDADYDVAATFTRGEVNSGLTIVTAAHADWAAERRTHNARVFMLGAAGLLVKR